MTATQDPPARLTAQFPHLPQQDQDQIIAAARAYLTTRTATDAFDRLTVVDTEHLTTHIQAAIDAAARATRDAATAATWLLDELTSQANVDRDTVVAFIDSLNASS